MAKTKTGRQKAAQYTHGSNFTSNDYDQDRLVKPGRIKRKIRGSWKRSRQ